MRYATNVTSGIICRAAPGGYQTSYPRDGIIYNMGKKWSEGDKIAAERMYIAGAVEYQIARALGRTESAVTNMLHMMRLEGLRRNPISISPAREWNDHLTLEGDALILPDFETPYHHAEFVNRVIDLAMSWGIGQLILAGDFVHFNNFSHWGEDFQPAKISGPAEDALSKIISLLPEDKRADAIAALEAAHLTTDQGGISAEMESVRTTVKELEGAFPHIKYIMGNHENRKLRAQEYGESPDELLRFFGADLTKWTASPYYWCNLRTENKYLYRIEHPKGAARNTAQAIAIQTQEHTIMGHSHRWAMNRDPSGRLYAIQAGHVVDEMRLAYCQQRTAIRDAHCLGAVIVRDGYPFLLELSSPWGRLKRM